MRKYFIWTVVIWLISILMVVSYAFGLFPLSQAGFLVLVVVLFLGAWRHPRQFFWLFLALLPLENIIISPTSFPISLRPYQLVGGILVLILLLSAIFKNKRINWQVLRFDCFICQIFKFTFCKIKDEKKYLNPLDRLVAVLGIASLVGVQFALDKALSLKLSFILFSFLGLYWLTRNFVRTKKQSLGGLLSVTDFRQNIPVLPSTRQKKFANTPYLRTFFDFVLNKTGKFSSKTVTESNPLEAIWFFLVGTDAVVLFGFYQMLAMKWGWPAFEVMSKRVNSTFTEPDWLGMYLIFVLALLLGFKYAFNIISKDKSGNILQKISDIRIFKWSAVKIGQVLLNIGLVGMIVVLVGTVSRSAWLGAGVVFGVYGIIIWLKQGFAKALKEGGVFLVVIISAVVILKIFGLSDFHLGNRAVSSVSGLQKITVSCRLDSALINGDRIKGIDELPNKSCRHISLEEIAGEKQAGKKVLEVYRPDPNVEIRKSIYQITWQEVKKHWLFGQGLGSSGAFLGKDDLGHRLNASNIFLEVLVSMGIIGLIPFLLIILTPLIFGLRFLQIRAGKYADKQKEFLAIFLLLTFFAILIPNLFNAGLLLGFFWIWLAVVMSGL